MGDHALASSERHFPSRASGGGGAVFAALDLGTSNCRLMLAVASRDDGFRVVDSVSRVVRLGEGLPETGRLGEAAMERAMGALDLCARRLGRHRVHGIAAVATEACRRATNGGDFLHAVRARTGIPIRVISTREEAGLVLDSCAALLGGDDGVRRALLFDIGGGSTELSWVRLPGHEGARAPELIGTASLPFGVVTLPEMLGANPYEPAGFDAMVSTVGERLLAFEATHRIADEIRHGGVRLLGTSGTVTTLAGEALGLQRYQRPLVDGTILSAAAAAAAVRRLRACDEAALARHPCIGVERASLVLPGCAIFEAIRRLWGAPEIVVADRGLREGLLLRLMREARAGAPRRPGAPAGGAASPRAPAARAGAPPGRRPGRGCRRTP